MQIGKGQSKQKWVLGGPRVAFRHPFLSCAQTSAAKDTEDGGLK